MSHGARSFALSFTRRLPQSTAVLALVAVHEELSSGVPVAGADDVVAALGLSTTAFLATVLSVPLFIGLLVEAPILAWSDRHRARRPQMTAAALVAVAAGLVVTAVSAAQGLGVVVLGAGVALTAVGLGVSSGVAEAMIVDEDPARSEQRLTRMTFWSIVGDVIAPVVVGACAAAGFGFSGAAFVVGAFAFVCALLVLNVQNPARAARPAEDGDDDDDDDDDDVGLAAAAKKALSTPWLLVWLFGAALCALLDETLVALIVLWAGGEFDVDGAGEVVVTVFFVGAAAGAFVAEKVLATASPLRMMAACCLVAACAFVAFLAVPGFLAACACAFVVGAAAAPLHPLAVAQAHRALPGRPGLVGASESLFLPIDILAPVAVAVVADSEGVLFALSLLLLQPLGLLVLAMAGLRRARRAKPNDD